MEYTIKVDTEKYPNILTILDSLKQAGFISLEPRSEVVAAARGCPVFVRDFSSKTNPKGPRHCVRRRSDDMLICSCKGYYYRNDCRHVELCR